MSRLVAKTPAVTETPMDSSRKSVKAESTVVLDGKVFWLKAQVLVANEIQLTSSLSYGDLANGGKFADIRLVGGPDNETVYARTRQVLVYPDSDPGHTNRGEKHPGWVGTCSVCGNDVEQEDWGNE